MNPILLIIPLIILIAGGFAFVKSNELKGIDYEADFSFDLGDSIGQLMAYLAMGGDATLKLTLKNINNKPVEIDDLFINLTDDQGNIIGYQKQPTGKITIPANGTKEVIIPMRIEPSFFAYLVRQVKGDGNLLQGLAEVVGSYLEQGKFGVSIGVQVKITKGKFVLELNENYEV